MSLDTLTSILDAVFCQDTVAPIADTSDGLHAATSVRRRLVRKRILLFLGEPVAICTMEPLFEASADLMPVLTVRMAYDSLVRRDLDIVW